MDNQNNETNTQASSGIFSGGTPETTTAPAPAPAPVSAPEPTEEAPADERQLLMARARLMGVQFSNNIATDKLRERISAALDGEPQKPEEPEAPAPVELNALTGKPANAPERSIRDQLFDEQMKLVRCRITCMDPKKKDLQGEIFTVANEFIGTVRKFIPFGEATEQGYHIPYCLYVMLEERRFLNIRTVKTPKGPLVESNYAKEFAIEVLPQLTESELARLATAQAAAGSID